MGRQSKWYPGPEEICFDSAVNDLLLWHFLVLPTGVTLFKMFGN
jgi:hypothetical protein